MKDLNGHMKISADQLGQLEAENRLLREVNQQLRAEKSATQNKLEQEQALEKKYQESQERFQSIFYKSKLGKKIIGPDLKILQINASLLAITQYAHPDFVHHWQGLQEAFGPGRYPLSRSRPAW